MKTLQATITQMIKEPLFLLSFDSGGSKFVGVVVILYCCKRGCSDMSYSHSLMAYFLLAFFFFFINSEKASLGQAFKRLLI